MCAPRALRVLELLEHDDAGALAEDEAVAVLVERAARRGRVVVAVREGARGDESAEAERA